MTDTTRDLIQRLVDIADTLDGRKPLVFSQGQVMDGFTALANFQALANEARDYLSQPEPEEPTLDCGDIDVPWWYRGDDFHVYREGYAAGWSDAARAVLARWPVAAIKPVPVSERLPGPEDCDAEGRCWWWDDDDDKWCLHEHSPRILCWTHWLPHYALPVPTTLTETNGQT